MTRSSNFLSGLRSIPELEDEPKAAKLTDHDRKAVQELRELVKEHLTPYYDTDFNLLRWLIGHDYDLEKIKPKLINHLLLRKHENWKLDEVASTPRNHPVHRYWMSGLTKEAEVTPNAILNIEQTGFTDFVGITSSFASNEILKARVHDIECMLKSVMEMEQKTGERASIIFVMDLTNLKLDRKLTSLITGSLGSLSTFMSDHYVELVHTFVIANAPSFFHMLWSLARPLLPERTRTKVNVLSSSWQLEMLDIAHPSALPEFWNIGSSTVFTAPLQRSNEMVPLELYYKGSMPKDSEVMIVKAGKTGTDERVLQEGQIVHYTIRGDGHFAFAIYYSNDPERDGEGVENWELIYPLFTKIPGSSNSIPLTDFIHCKKSGTYRLWISNEHAWFHTLKITHHLKIEDPL